MNHSGRCSPFVVSPTNCSWIQYSRTLYDDAGRSKTLCTHTDPGLWTSTPSIWFFFHLRSGLETAACPSDWIYDEVTPLFLDGSCCGRSRSSVVCVVEGVGSVWKYVWSPFYTSLCVYVIQLCWRKGQDIATFNSRTCRSVFCIRTQATEATAAVFQE